MSSRLDLPEAGWFGARERRAFGWFHAAAPSRDLGVVLCPPLGHEMLFTHRAYRHLATRLAAAGFPALRFDYHGTGDSAGDDYEPDRVEAWLASVDDAVEAMRATGVARVALFGMRMGGTLAAAAAARRGDVAAIALVAPSASGSAYLREVRAMQRLRDAEGRSRFEGEREGDEEAIGFVFRRETIEALGKIDLRALDEPPAPAVLVVPRDNLPGPEERLAARFRTLGGRADVVRAPGYASVATDDPYTSEVPDAIWAAVVEWFEGLAPEAAEPAPRLLTGLEARVEIGASVVESTLRCGPDGQLFGVLSEPAAGARNLAVVVSNTGANSRVGPSRLGVKLARRLAARGHAVLRLDLGGVGDSPPRAGRAENDLFATHSIDDVRAAIDALAARGYRRFAATGLCAGAYMSFHAALADPRVRGVALINPPAFEWAPGRKVERVANRPMKIFRSTRHYKQRVLRRDTWARLVRGEVDVRGIGAMLARRLRERAAVGVKRAAVLAGRGEWAMTESGAQIRVARAARHASPSPLQRARGHARRGRPPPRPVHAMAARARPVAGDHRPHRPRLRAGRLAGARARRARGLRRRARATREEPMIDYKTGNDLDLDAVIALYRASTLGERRPVDDRERMRAMLAGANLVVSAWDGPKLVGISRSLSDFAYSTYLSNLAVNLAYQRRGIGKELVRRTQELGGRATVFLFAAPAAVDYYPRVGFSAGSGWMLRSTDRVT